MQFVVLRGSIGCAASPTRTSISRYHFSMGFRYSSGHRRTSSAFLGFPVSIVNTPALHCLPYDIDNIGVKSFEPFDHLLYVDSGLPVYHLISGTSLRPWSDTTYPRRPFAYPCRKTIQQNCAPCCWRKLALPHHPESPPRPFSPTCGRHRTPAGAASRCLERCASAIHSQQPIFSCPGPLAASPRQ